MKGLLMKYGPFATFKANSSGLMCNLAPKIGAEIYIY